MAVLQADGKYDLEMNVNIGDGGDMWLPGMKLAPGDGKTFPNSDSYQGGNIKKTGVTIEVMELNGQNIDLKITVPSRRDGAEDSDEIEKFSAPMKEWSEHQEAQEQFQVPDAEDGVRISGKIPQLPWREEQLLEITTSAASTRSTGCALLLAALMPMFRPLMITR